MVQYYPAINVMAVILIAALSTLQTDARSGCASFGHSCYGGIGKRSELVGTDEIGSNNMQESGNRAYELTVPRTNFQKSPNYNRLFPGQFIELKKYINELIANCRRAEDIQQK